MLPQQSTTSYDVWTCSDQTITVLQLVAAKYCPSCLSLERPCPPLHWSQRPYLGRPFADLHPAVDAVVNFYVADYRGALGGIPTPGTGVTHVYTL